MSLSEESCVLQPAGSFAGGRLKARTKANYAEPGGRDSLLMGPAKPPGLPLSDGFGAFPRRGGEKFYCFSECYFLNV